ncbi:glycosyltransferase family 2 protein [Fibrobacter sp.]|uniref:glycosyltransferase family 2 protein n=1 Tax=Fibrobacter sp. TaxID=35828 RepID=UPI00386AF2BF
MISIVLPSYNRARIISNAIESILRQTYRDFELIVVDDGSTDNTEEVVRAFNDDRIVYVKQKNAGACVARNNGIAHARGEYIAFQDSDDIWHADKLEKQIAALVQNQADLVFSRMRKMKDGAVQGLVSDYFHEGFLKPSDFPLSIGTQTLLGKREIFECEKFDRDMPRFQELELLLRAKKKFSVYCIEEPLVDYCLQNDSISVNVSSVMKAWKLILAKHPDFFRLYGSSRERIARDVQLNAKSVSDFAKRWRLALFSFKFSKSPKTLARFIKWFVL